VSKYDAQVTEDNNASFLNSCVRDFTDMWNFKWTQEVPVVLFLNKKDIFEEKMRTLPMNHFFLDFTGSDYDSALAYLHRLFRSPTEHLKNSSYSLNSSFHSTHDSDSSSSITTSQPKTTKNLLHRNRSTFKKLQIHNICALDKDNVNLVFNAIRDSAWMKRLVQ